MAAPRLMAVIPGKRDITRSAENILRMAPKGRAMRIIHLALMHPENALTSFAVVERFRNRGNDVAWESFIIWVRASSESLPPCCVATTLRKNVITPTV